MSVSFEQSETRQNLLRAFAGESQARNRYVFSAELAKQKNLEVLQAVFLFTADQEQSHAKVFYDFLSSQTGNNISIDGNYPIDIYDDMARHLRAAQHNEYQEYEHDYAEFSRIADEEGFVEISHTFRMIAGIEQTHGERFGKFADLLEQNQLFISDVETGWMCLHCGHIIHSTMAPALCPVCKSGQGYFIRLKMAPFGSK